MSFKYMKMYIVTNFIIFFFFVCACFQTVNANTCLAQYTEEKNIHRLVDESQVEPIFVKKNIKLKNETFIEIYIESKDPLIKKWHLEEVQNELLQVISFVDGYIEIPPKVDVILQYHNLTGIEAVVYGGANYNPGKKILTLPYSYREETKDNVFKTKHPKYSRSAWRHEFAHALFHNYNLIHRSEWSKMYSLIEEDIYLKSEASRLSKKSFKILKNNFSSEVYEGYSNLFKDVQNRGAELSKTLEEIDLLEAYNEISTEKYSESKSKEVVLKKKFDTSWMSLIQYIMHHLNSKDYTEYIELKTQLGVIEQQQKILQKDILKIDELKTPYDELWADLLDVFYVNDPESISRTVNFNKKAHNRENRRFNKRIKLSSLPTSISGPTNVKTTIYTPLGEKFIFITSITKWGADNRYKPYNILDATKSHLWKYYLSNPIYANNKGLLLKKIIKVLADEVSERLSNNSLTYLSPKEMNVRLISKFDAELSR